MGRWRLRLFWAAVLAAATAWGVWAYLASLRQTEPVVVANVAIPARTLITPDMLATVQVSRQDRARLAGDAFGAATDVAGRHARRPFAAGEVLRDRPGDLTAPGEIHPGPSPGEGALADFLPPGTQAVTLNADPQAVLGRHLRPGDRVNLIYTSRTDATGGVYSRLLLQHVRVLDIERGLEAGADSEILVTVLVTPEQAVELALAKRTGVIDLALNPPDPGDPVAVPPVSPLQFAGRTARTEPPGRSP